MIYTEKEIIKAYQRYFGREFDDKRRKQEPLPLEIIEKMLITLNIKIK